MKIDVSDLNALQVHALMRGEGIAAGVLHSVGEVTWLVFNAQEVAVP